MSLTIADNESVALDPADIRVLTFDWNESNLPVGVAITSSVFTITVVRQGGVTALTKDNETTLAGNRTTQVRLNATTATVRDQYILSNKIVTNEAPAQTKERSIRVRIVER